MAKLIKIKRARKVVFVGDTHGDLQASQKIIKTYLREENKIVFLGDYVDRGKNSRENLEFLLKTKKEYPTKVFLLQGNHEGHRILEFSPADFWESLSKEDYQKYTGEVEKLPLVLTVGPIIALHGALPNIKNLEEIEKIRLGDKRWLEIVWGDFAEKPGGFLGTNPLTGRPEFGVGWFEKIMKKLEKKVLIRSHDPHAPRFMFKDRCLTIFTSSAYGRKREIAILNREKKMETAKDLEVVRV